MSWHYCLLQLVARLQISVHSLFFQNIMSQINFAKTCKFPAEIMKHDPMDIHASSAIPQTINQPPKRIRAYFHQQVMLMSGQNNSHLPTFLHHI